MTSVSDSNSLWVNNKKLKWDRSSQHIASIPFSCRKKLQSTLLCHLYHLLQSIAFASLVPLFKKSIAVIPNSLEGTTTQVIQMKV